MPNLLWKIKETDLHMYLNSRPPPSTEMCQIVVYWPVKASIKGICQFWQCLTMNRKTWQLNTLANRKAVLEWVMPSQTWAPNFIFCIPEHATFMLTCISHGCKRADPALFFRKEEGGVGVEQKLNARLLWALLKSFPRNPIQRFPFISLSSE